MPGCCTGSPGGAPSGEQGHHLCHPSPAGQMGRSADDHGDGLAPVPMPARADALAGTCTLKSTAFSSVATAAYCKAEASTAIPRRLAEDIHSWLQGTSEVRGVTVGHMLAVLRQLPQSPRHGEVRRQAGQGPSAGPGLALHSRRQVQGAAAPSGGSGSGSPPRTGAQSLQHPPPSRHLGGGAFCLALLRAPGPPAGSHPPHAVCSRAGRLSRRQVRRLPGGRHGFAGRFRRHWQALHGGQPL